MYGIKDTISKEKHKTAEKGLPKRGAHPCHIQRVSRNKEGKDQYTNGWE